MLQNQSHLAYSFAYAPTLGLANCYVSKVDEDIKAQVSKLGGKVIYSSAHLATDTTPTFEMSQHALGHVNYNDGWVVLWQGTNPLRLKQTSEELKQTGTDSLFTITPHGYLLKDISDFDTNFKTYTTLIKPNVI
jgi:CMP-N-acetylneuraminic acid synthetase